MSIPMSNQGMTIGQAARKLGVSTRTIRRHIKAGKIKAELVGGPFGDEYRIYNLEKESETKEESVDGTTGQAEIKDTSNLLAYIKELQEKNLALAAQFGAASERIKNLESQVKLLSAPKEPWWRRIFPRKNT